MAGIDSARTGKCQYIYWQEDDESPTGVNRFGRVTDADLQYAEPPDHTNEVGGTDALIGKMVVPTLTINMILEAVGLAYTDNPVVDLPFRDSSGYPCSDLTAFGAILGSEYQETVLGLKVGQMALSCAFNSVLKCQLQCQGLSITEDELAAPSLDAPGDPFGWHNTTLEFESASYGIRSYTWTLSNGLIPLSDCDGADTDAKRFPKVILPGNESCKLDLTTLKQIALADLGAVTDEIVGDLTFTATHLDPSGNSLVLALTTMATGRAGVPFTNGDGLVEYPYSFELKYNDEAARTLTFTPAA